MADNFKDIVLGTFGATQLAAGEHTALTTDANTSYVITDVYVENYGVGEVSTKINGFSIEGWGERLISDGKGEIMPPSSSLTFEVSNIFPATYYYAKTNYVDAGQVYLNTDIEATVASGEKVAVPAAEIDLKINSAASVENAYAGNQVSIYKFGVRIYVLSHDSNSQFNMQYSSDDGATFTRINPSTSYLPCWFDEENEIVYYMKQNGTSVSFCSWTHSGGEVVIKATVQAAALSAFTTYPRACFSSGWCFYIPSMSANNSLRAIDPNGTEVYFQSLNAHNYFNGPAFQFAVGFDGTGFSFLRTPNGAAGEFQLAKPATTKAAMDGFVAGSLNYISSYSYQHSPAPPLDLNISSWTGAKCVGTTNSASRFYFIKNDGNYNKIVGVDVTGPTTPVSTTYLTVSNSKKVTNLNFGAPVFADQAAIEATGADGVCFKVRAVGVEATT